MNASWMMCSFAGFKLKKSFTKVTWLTLNMFYYTIGCGIHAGLFIAQNEAFSGCIDEMSGSFPGDSIPHVM